MKRSKERLGKPICHSCRVEIDPILNTRSRLWAFNTPGVHFLYCTRTCRDLHERTA